MVRTHLLFRKRAVSALVLILCLHGFSIAGTATARKAVSHSKSLAEQIKAILASPELARAHWGIDVVEQPSGKVLYSLNSDQLFLPASNAKLFTTAAALAFAGPDYRFHTTVETTGKIDDKGRLQGDLVIVGRGDPNISGRVMPYQLKTERIAPHTQILEDLAAQVAQKGLRIVDGDVVGDDTYYSPERYGQSWGQDDLQWIDGAPVSALTFNDNVIFLDIQPGQSPGDKALVTQETDTNYYDFDNRIVTTAAGIVRKVGVHRDPGSKKVVLWGTIPIGDKGMKAALAIEDPAEYTAQLFQKILQQHGITVTGKARARHGDIAQFFDQMPATPPVLPEIANAVPSPTTPSPAPPAVATFSQSPSPAAVPTVLAEHISLPLIEDVRVTNKTSENLHAELDLRLVGKLGGMTPSFEGGAAVVRQFLRQAGINDDEFVFLDGSGLSRRDLVTPDAVIKLLLYASRQPWGAAYEQTLPVSGVDGSLEERFVNTPAGGLVHAKTGTLSHVSALSGYGETKSGGHFVFSILCNNHNLPTGRVLTAIDSIVQALVRQKLPKQ
ncbi:MAG TPA: D-alanyl-D-alanine carboxypeptidase/D-alanyl-D-alanine-endopeptidase [Candidatus Angelobacter sp.]|nr:D-alanyl-D-alanine carboxypeptidase/D-alanyl-D-alanine-endopeptidase [Candidatus Angelobacter sp.]